MSKAANLICSNPAGTRQPTAGKADCISPVATSHSGIVSTKEVFSYASMPFTKLGKFYPASKIKYKTSIQRTPAKSPLLQSFNKAKRKIISRTFSKNNSAFKRLNCTPNYIIRYTLTGWLGNCECSLEPKTFPLTKPDTPPRESSFAHHKRSCNPCSEQSNVQPKCVMPGPQDTKTAQLELISSISGLRSCSNFIVQSS